MNPTVFEITVEDVDEIMWLVDNPETAEVLLPSGMQRHSREPLKQLGLIKTTIALHGHVFATYYRPGAFWEEEVFVCPRCKHATQIEYAETDIGWYCKYCYNEWSCSADRGMFIIETESQEDKE